MTKEGALHTHTQPTAHTLHAHGTHPSFYSLLLVAGAGTDLRVLKLNGAHVILLDGFFSLVLAEDGGDRGCCVFMCIKSGLCIAVIRHIRRAGIFDCVVFFTLNDKGKLSPPQKLFGAERSHTVA